MTTPTPASSRTNAPLTRKALANTQGLFRAAAETNGFADHARDLETRLAEATEALREIERYLQLGHEAHILKAKNYSTHFTAASDLARQFLYRSPESKQI